MSDIVCMEGVTKTYGTGETRVQALRGITLTVAQGEIATIQGPSGSGKSTLLNLCGLLDTPDAGRVALAGREIDGLSERKLTDLRREYIGFVFQGFNLVPVMTARENVEYPLLIAGASLRERQRRVAEVLEQVGMQEHADRRPDHLSGGQRQRVAIARALVKTPALVIADEPTANLDTATANQVIDLMHDLGGGRGVTFLIATHDERMANRCDRVLTLVDGVLT